MLPILFQFKGFEVYTYPLFWGLSWGLCYFLSKERIERNGLNQNGLSFFFLGSFFSSWIGAKVFFLMANSPNVNWITYWQFWLGGGFVFYGGLIFALLFVFLFLFFGKSLIGKKHIGLILPFIPLSHGLGRLGCFLSGCCFGKETDLYEIIGLHQHPVQVYESLSLFSMGGLLYWWQRQTKPKLETSLGFFVLAYGVLRFNLEFLRGDDFRGSLGNLSYSQGISLGLVIIIIGLFIFENKKVGPPA